MVFLNCIAKVEYNRTILLLSCRKQVEKPVKQRKAKQIDRFKLPPLKANKDSLVTGDNIANNRIHNAKLYIIE